MISYLFNRLILEELLQSGHHPDIVRLDEVLSEQGDQPVIVTLGQFLHFELPADAMENAYRHTVQISA